MKIKSDFVTNSSSSNFVIGFPFIPKNEGDVHKMLFGGDVESFVSGCQGDSYSSKEISKTIFNCMKDQIPNNEQNIFNAIVEGWFDGRPAINQFIKSYGKNWDADFEAYAFACDEKAKEITQKYLNQFSTLFFYTFSFEDDNQYDAMLESGEIFEKMVGERIDCH